MSEPNIMELLNRAQERPAVYLPALAQAIRELVREREMMASHYEAIERRYAEVLDERDEARRTSQFHKDNHLAAETEIERLTQQRNEAAKLASDINETATKLESEIERLRGEIARLNSPVLLSEWQQQEAEIERLRAENTKLRDQITEIPTLCRRHEAEIERLRGEVGRWKLSHEAVSDEIAIALARQAEHDAGIAAALESITAERQRARMPDDLVERIRLSNDTIQDALLRDILAWLEQGGRGE